MAIIDLEELWKTSAKSLLDDGKRIEKSTDPESVMILLSWKNGEYTGLLQEIAQEYSKEIVLLRKCPRPVDDGLIEAIKRLYPEIPKIQADSSLRLRGTKYILRQLENKLTQLTPEQKEYIKANPPKIYEL
jgi:hypothetical protein